MWYILTYIFTIFHYVKYWYILPWQLVGIVMGKYLVIDNIIVASWRERAVRELTWTSEIIFPNHLGCMYKPISSEWTVWSTGKTVIPRKPVMWNLSLYSCSWQTVTLPDNLTTTFNFQVSNCCHIWLCLKGWLNCKQVFVWKGVVCSMWECITIHKMAFVQTIWWIMLRMHLLASSKLSTTTVSNWQNNNQIALS